MCHPPWYGRASDPVARWPVELGLNLTHSDALPHYDPQHEKMNPPAAKSSAVRPVEVAAFQLCAEATLELVQDALRTENIGVLTLKGMHLGHVYYDDPVEREYGDLDMLVRPAQFPRAVEALQRVGFRRVPFPSKRLATARGFYCYTLVSPYAVPVEIHRGFASHGRYFADVEQLFGHAVKFRVGRTEALGLCAEDLLCHLCVHACKSDYFFIAQKHVRDVERIVRRARVDWTELVDRLEQAGCAAGSYYLLVAANRQYGAGVPLTILELLRPRGVRRWWLDRYLNPSTFPIYRFPEHNTAQIQWRVAFPLIDNPWRWPGVALRYSLARLLDWTAGHSGAAISGQRGSKSI